MHTCAQAILNPKLTVEALLKRYYLRLYARFRGATISQGTQTANICAIVAWHSRTFAIATRFNVAPKSYLHLYRNKLLNDSTHIPIPASQILVKTLHFVAGVQPLAVSARLFLVGFAPP